jgi:hypothetical protein
VLAAQGMRGRLSGTGAGLDHALAEPCVGSFTHERTPHRDDATRQETTDAIIDDIEMCYHINEMD